MYSYNIESWRLPNGSHCTHMWWLMYTYMCAVSLMISSLLYWPPVLWYITVGVYPNVSTRDISGQEWGLPWFRGATVIRLTGYMIFLFSPLIKKHLTCVPPSWCDIKTFTKAVLFLLFMFVWNVCCVMHPLILWSASTVVNLSNYIILWLNMCDASWSSYSMYSYHD